MSEVLFPSLTSDQETIALVENDKSYTYTEVNSRINRFASGLLGKAVDLEEERVSLFLPASMDYVTVLIGVWRAGGIAVPLNVASSTHEEALEEVLARDEHPPVHQRAADFGAELAVERYLVRLNSGVSSMASQG